jgi:hypothetical protein
MAASKTPKPVKGKGKVETVLREYKSGKLHTGSKTGPVVKSKKQAIAIGLSEQRKKDAAKKKKKMI